MTFRDSKHSILAESDDRGGAEDVIDVNVVILHSKSSRALHKHLTSSASSASCSTSREDVSAKESDNKSFLQVSYMNRVDRKSQVRQCLGYCSADS